MLAQDVLGFIEENDVKFVRLAFMDLFGRLKNIAVQPDLLAQAFDTGLPFDATAIDGFHCDADGDLLLRPDPETLCMLPWRPQAGRVCRLLCDVLTPDGQPYPADPRGILRHTMAIAQQKGFTVRIGSECEFYLFEADERGAITTRPQDRAGYLDVSPLDRGEDVRREISLTLASMNIQPESSHHERGPGQNRIDFHRADPVTSADHQVAFQNAVRTIASRYGLRASFMPKPLADEVGNAFHINMSLYKNRNNLFRMENGLLGEDARSAMAGVLQRLPEITLFTNPLPNSYDRLTDNESPNRMCWSTLRGRSALRLPLPQHRFARMQVASPDPTCNVYLAYSLIIRAALEGIENRESLPEACERDWASRAALPESLPEAIALARASEFVARSLPTCVTEAFLKGGEELLRLDRLDKTSLFNKEFERY
ncbi:MAG TPA: glutamine synthetase family protein [Candidatus Limiplasma sp.]|nr:glutamine synthetase family protein [Candidatus Limiplasma sp.]HPS82520.1 glutamine synthetase family protein [Candidatus Limiplasma sp.]